MALALIHHDGYRRVTTPSKALLMPLVIAAFYGYIDVAVAIVERDPEAVQYGALARTRITNFRGVEFMCEDASTPAEVARC